MKRTEQIHIRVTAEEREKIEIAAEKDRRTLSEFLVVAALKAAKKVVDIHKED